MTAKNDGTGQNDMWHYAVGSDRKGPVPRPTLAKLLASGEISAETYVWQPGMDNWVHLGDAAPLKPLVAGLDGDGLPEDFVEEDTQFSSADDVRASHAVLDIDEGGLSQDTIVEQLPMVSNTANSGHTMVMGSRGPAPARATAPKVEAAKAPASDLFATAASSSPSGSSVHGSDIFSTATTGAQQPSHSDIFATSQPAAEDENIAGVHGRRQSSVLFSLDELGREDGKKPSAGVNEAFVTDSSGLIDIKAVATSSKAPPGEDPFGSGAGLSMPQRSMGPGAVAIPLTTRKSNLGPWIIAAAVLIAGGVAAAIVVSGGNNEQAKGQQVAQNEPAPKEKPAEAKPEAKPTEPSKPLEPVVAEVKTPEPTKAPEPVANPEPTKAPEPVANTEVKAEPAAATAAEKAAAEKKAAEDKKKADEKKKADDAKKNEDKKTDVVVAPENKEPKSTAENTSKVNNLLGKLEGKNEQNNNNAAPEEGTPPKLSAAVVRATIKNKFGRCGAMVTSGGPVSVTTSFVIANSGVVQSARVVDAAGVGADVQGCVVAVIKGTTFGKFTEPTMTVNLPVKLL